MINIEDSNNNLYTHIYRAEASTKDEFYNYVLFFNGDIKRDIHLWLEDNDFKALLY
jgi:hypothetical protein